MSNVIARNLLILTGLLSLSGCETTPVRNSTPDPYFLTCQDIDELAKPAISDQLIGEQVEQTTVMLKLRDRQSKEDQIKLGGCHASK